MSNVLKVSLQEAIRSLHEKGWGQRRIARELEVHRNTVKGYIEGASKFTTQSTVAPIAVADPKCTSISPVLEVVLGSSAKLKSWCGGRYESGGILPV